MKTNHTKDETTNHPTYYDTIVNHPYWQKWGEVAHKHGFDWYESVECGWLSPKHFQAFLDWYVKNQPNP